MIPILCDSSKTLAELISDKTNGLGRLTDATAATVTEERNGAYYLEITYPATGRLFSQISNGGIIKAKPNDNDDPQLFRIAQITTPISGQVEILAYHIGYDLARAIVLPFSATGASAALTAMKSAMVGGSAFAFSTDISDTTTAFSVSGVESVRAAIGGSDGLVETFNAELKWDGLNVEMLTARGADNGVAITYGKNLTDVKQEAILDEMYTMIVPYYQSGDTLTRGTDFILQSVSDDNVRVLALDVSPYLDVSSGGTPDVNDIDAACAYYVKNHPELTTPAVSLDVSFQPLWKTKNYASIVPAEHVSLCDTVTVRYAKLGISAKAKVTKTVYNVLTNSYDSITLGQPKRNITDTIVSVSTLVDVAQTTAEKAQETASSGGGGGSSSATEMTDGTLTWGTAKTVTLAKNDTDTGAQFTGNGTVETNLADGNDTFTMTASTGSKSSVVKRNNYGEAGVKMQNADGASGIAYIDMYTGTVSNAKASVKSRVMINSSGVINASANRISIGPNSGIMGITIDSTTQTAEIRGLKKVSINPSYDDAYITVDRENGAVRIYGKNGIYANGTKIA